jgi:hypothetical protein
MKEKTERERFQYAQSERRLYPFSGMNEGRMKTIAR